MKKKKSKIRERICGFTLVELIVVLVILAILAALLVPALTGYIDQARRKKIMMECRQCVVAAQTILNTKYAGDPGYVLTRDLDGAAILTLAEVGDAANPNAFLYKEMQSGAGAGTLPGKLMHLYYTNGGLYATYCGEPDTCPVHDEAYTVTDHPEDRNLGEEDVRTKVIESIVNAGIKGAADSGAAQFPGSVSAKAVETLKALGINMEDIGATSWSYTTNGGGFLYWSRVDITNKAAQTKVPVLRYNKTTGTYTVWIASLTDTAQAEAAGGTKYITYGKDYAPYTPSTTQPASDQTYKNALEKYEEAMKQYGYA